MRILRRFPVFVVALTALTIGLARPAGAATVTLHSTMIGANEVPGPGDPNATGSTVIQLNSDNGMVCYTIKTAGVTNPPLTAGHIHVGAAGVAGPVVIPLPLTGGPNLFGGCTFADPALVAKIIANPKGYYTNVHDAKYPAGVMRGQLSTF